MSGAGARTPTPGAWGVGLALLSGAAALAVETTWLRWLRLLLGATAPAASATLVAFLLGQALGAALAARRLARTARPLRAYGRVECGAAAAALAVPALLAVGELALCGLYDALLPRPALLTATRFGVALVATLPAAVAFGASLPLLVAAAVPEVRALGRTGAGLYAANVLGAAAGTALATFWLPETLGVRGGYGVGLGLSLLAGAVALLRARAGEGRTEAPLPGAGGAPRPTAGVGGRLLGLAALSGFGVFAAEVLAVQAFAQVLNQSVFAFGAVLVTVLVCLALGAGLASWACGRLGIPPRSLLGLALGASGLAWVAFPAVLQGATQGLSYLGSESAWPGYLWKTLGTVAATGGPGLLFAGLVFPLTLALAGGDGDGSRVGDDGAHEGGARLGWLLAANTLGAIAGALAATYLLLPVLGLWPAFLALGLLYALAAVFLHEAVAAHRWLRDGVLAAGWIAVMTLASPLDVPLVPVSASQRVLWQATTPAGVVSVVADDTGERLIRTDNHYNLGGTGEIVHEERQGHLPLLLHPAPRHVAFLGSATGISAGAALAHDVESVTLVELVPGVAEAARDWFGEHNRGVYRDPRSRVVTDDARNFMRLTERRFDVVVGDLFVPWRAGVGALYTREHFEAVRTRLGDDGVFCQWLPLYQLSETEFETIAATFLDVFPAAGLFRGDFYGFFPIAALCGFRSRAPAPDRVAAAAERLAARGESDRWVTHPVGVWALHVGPLAPLADAWRETPRNTDDRPRIEYRAARGHLGGDRGSLRPLVGLDWARMDERVRSAAAATGATLFPGLPPEARAAIEGGAALQGANALFAADRPEASARALEAAAQLLPPQLLHDTPPDPTASDVWFAGTLLKR